MNIYYDSRSVDHRAESPTPSLLSVKSDHSKGMPPKFSNEPGPPHTKYVNPPLVQYTITLYLQYKIISPITSGPGYLIHNHDMKNNNTILIIIKSTKR